MMKTQLLLTFLICLFFVSCSDDEDNNCVRCESNFFEDEIVQRYCDNGDGTITVFDEFLGSETIIDLEGESFSDFIEAVDDSGVFCYN